MKPENCEVRENLSSRIQPLRARLFFMLLFSPADKHFQKNLSVSLSQCQTVLIQARTDVVSVLICVQTVFKGNQQTKKVIAGKERVYTCKEDNR